MKNIFEFELVINYMLNENYNINCLVLLSETNIKNNKIIIQNNNFNINKNNKIYNNITKYISFTVNKNIKLNYHDIVLTLNYDYDYDIYGFEYILQYYNEDIITKFVNDFNNFKLKYDKEWNYEIYTIIYEISLVLYKIIKSYDYNIILDNWWKDEKDIFKDSLWLV